MVLSVPRALFVTKHTFHKCRVHGRLCVYSMYSCIVGIVSSQGGQPGRQGDLHLLRPQRSHLCVCFCACISTTMGVSFGQVYDTTYPTYPTYPIVTKPTFHKCRVHGRLCVYSMYSCIVGIVCSHGDQPGRQGDLHLLRPQRSHLCVCFCACISTTMGVSFGQVYDTTYPTYPTYPFVTKPTFHKCRVHQRLCVYSMYSCIVGIVCSQGFVRH